MRPRPNWSTRLLVSLCLALLSAAAHAADPAPPGGLAGRITDSDTTAPLPDVTVTVSGRTDTRTSDANGEFAFPDLPPGHYELRFAKDGYRELTLPDVTVAAGATERANATLTPETAALPPPEPSDVEEFVIVASPVAEIMAASRLESDEMINTLGAGEIDKLAVGDVGEALKFVPGVNVVKGQFAVIRGLEDRYSSTLYNSAPVPSPDPDRQSVQLDLFPSDIVSDIVVAKTFAPDLPSNSAAGSINILTYDYPEELTLKVSGGTGFNQNAWGKFLDFQDGSPVGDEDDGWDTLESDYGAMFGGRTEALGREIRFKAIVNNEVDYDTAEGFQQTREPKRCRDSSNPICAPGLPEAGDLAFGDLSLSGGKYDYTESARSEQFTSYGGLGFDLDEAGDHKIDASVFYTTFHDEAVELRENGFLPKFDYGVLAEKQANGEEVLPQDLDGFATFNSQLRNFRDFPSGTPERGGVWFTNFDQSRSFDTERKLQLYQINGDHRLETLDGLHVTWAGNYAKTNQDESARGMEYFFEPDDVNQTPPTQFPVKANDLGPGQFATNGGLIDSQNHIEETAWFGRLDTEYERDLTDYFTVTLRTGGWYENADRDVNANFIENPIVGTTSQFVVFGDTPQQLGRSVFDQINGFLRESTNESNRKIQGWNLGGKGTFWDDYDLLAGFRLEDIHIESLNDPFTGTDDFTGAPAIFPGKYLFFDRLDNPARGECTALPLDPTHCAPRVYNDQLLGIKLPIDPATGLVDLTNEQEIRSLVDGHIDEMEFLPSLGFAYRPYEGVSFRGAWSKTVARPSFREMGYYVSVEPGTDDFTVGNPQLKLSDVESYDLRLEYLHGEHGDLGAVSFFYKKIDDPIESIVIRDAANFEANSSALFRTFFNNPNTARLKGVEIEARKALDFVPVEWLEYLSIGGNFTYIDAKVDRTQAEIDRAQPFFDAPAGTDVKYKHLSSSRRLYGQPEWIANADISFDHPDWGSKVTLAFFAISSVLDAAGSAFLAPSGAARDFTLDRYIDSYYSLDLILSQEIVKGLVFKTSIKNLTDSRRRIIYDPYQTSEDIPERSFKIGQDYSFSLTYTYEF